MITKKYSEHNVSDSPYAREMREILNSSEYDKAAVAIAVDLEQMAAHYHKTFDEIFFVLDGDMKFEFYDPETENIWTVESSKDEWQSNCCPWVELRPQRRTLLRGNFL